jgi:hypothetical protein
MRKILMGVFVAAIAVAIGSTAALAAGVKPAVGPYQGQFSGQVNGDRNSQAPLSLDLTQQGDQITGKVAIGDGLFIDGGLCGQVAVPATEQFVTGQTLTGHPDRLSTELAFNVSSLRIVVDLESRISPDREKIEAQASIDLPWLCGRDPVITGVLQRED